MALVRTGWTRHWTDPATYLGLDTGVPGVDPSGAGWLADHRIALTGADTTADEQIPASVGLRVLPVRRLLLVEAGIYIIERMRPESLAEAGVTEFLSWCDTSARRSSWSRTARRHAWCVPRL